MPVHRVVLESESSPLVDELVSTLRSRGLKVDLAGVEGAGSFVAAKVLSSAPTPKEAAGMAEFVESQAAGGRPVVLLMPPAPSKGKADESAASWALLRAHGAALCLDPEVWVECIVLLSAYGPPLGPNAAIVAPPNTWLAAAAAAAAKRAEGLGQRFAPIGGSTSSVGATDIVLADASALAAERGTKILVVPVAGRPQICADRPVLVGLRNALLAAETLGHASARIGAGTGPSETPLPAKAVERDRFSRQLAKLSLKAGDHECKVLLSSYGIEITRQAVATTPSAATRIAKKAGYPVELKPWGEDQPSELEGCLVIREVASAAEVRRAFSTVCSATEAEAAIIRETPPEGREVRVLIREQACLGTMVFLYQRGHLEPAAALAPLRAIDADRLAQQVVASRAADAPPDWNALAELLTRASHLVTDNPRVHSLELTRVVVGEAGEGVMVVDARATLIDR